MDVESRKSKSSDHHNDGYHQMLTMSRASQEIYKNPNFSGEILSKDSIRDGFQSDQTHPDISQDECHGHHHGRDHSQHSQKHSDTRENENIARTESVERSYRQCRVHGQNRSHHKGTEYDQNCPMHGITKELDEEYEHTCGHCKGHEYSEEQEQRYEHIQVHNQGHYYTGKYDEASNKHDDNYTNKHDDKQSNKHDDKFREKQNSVEDSNHQDSRNRSKPESQDNLKQSSFCRYPRIFGENNPFRFSITEDSNKNLPSRLGLATRSEFNRQMTEKAKASFDNKNNTDMLNLSHIKPKIGLENPFREFAKSIDEKRPVPEEIYKTSANDAKFVGEMSMKYSDDEESGVVDNKGSFCRANDRHPKSNDDERNINMGRNISNERNINHERIGNNESITSARNISNNRNSPEDKSNNSSKNFASDLHMDVKSYEATMYGVRFTDTRKTDNLTTYINSLSNSRIKIENNKKSTLENERVCGIFNVNPCEKTSGRSKNIQKPNQKTSATFSPTINRKPSAQRPLNSINPLPAANSLNTSSIKSNLNNSQKGFKPPPAPSFNENIFKPLEIPTPNEKVLARHQKSKNEKMPDGKMLIERALKPLLDPEAVKNQLDKCELNINSNEGKEKMLLPEKHNEEYGDPYCEESQTVKGEINKSDLNDCNKSSKESLQSNKCTNERMESKDLRVKSNEQSSIKSDNKELNLKSGEELTMDSDSNNSSVESSNESCRSYKESNRYNIGSIKSSKGSNQSKSSIYSSKDSNQINNSSIQFNKDSHKADKSSIQFNKDSNDTNKSLIQSNKDSIETNKSLFQSNKETNKLNESNNASKYQNNQKIPRRYKMTDYDEIKITPKFKRVSKLEKSRDVDGNQNDSMNQGNSEALKLKNNKLENRILKDNALDNSKLENRAFENRSLAKRMLENRTLETNKLENNKLENIKLENNKFKNRTLENNTLENCTLENNTLVNLQFNESKNLGDNALSSQNKSFKESCNNSANEENAKNAREAVKVVNKNQLRKEATLDSNRQSPKNREEIKIVKDTRNLKETSGDKSTDTCKKLKPSEINELLQDSLGNIDVENLPPGIVENEIANLSQRLYEKSVESATKRFEEEQSKLIGLLKSLEKIICGSHMIDFTNVESGLAQLTEELKTNIIRDTIEKHELSKKISELNEKLGDLKEENINIKQNNLVKSKKYIV